MAQETAEKRRYRVPSVYVEAECSLDQFQADEIAEYLLRKGCGPEAHSGAGLFISPQEIDRIETLAICGQRDSARELLFWLFNKATGRQL